MKIILLALAILILNPPTASAQMEVVGSVKTAVGVISIIKVDDNSFSVVLNGKLVERDGVSSFDGEVITNEENVYVNFGRHFVVGDAEVFLLESSGGGNISGITHRIISVWKDGAVSVSQYIGNGAVPKITQREQSLIFNFPVLTTIEGRMKAESWVWLDGKTKRVVQESLRK
jgi:hypothetical protein